MAKSITQTTAAEIMRVDLVSASVNQTVVELLQMLREHKITGAPVVDESGKLVGVVSLTDVNRYAADAVGKERLTANKQSAAFYHFTVEHANEFEIMEGYYSDRGHSVTVAEIMTPSIISVPESATVQQIAKTMVDHHIHRVLVKGSDSLTGIISTMDVMRVVADHGK